MYKPVMEEVLRFFSYLNHRNTLNVKACYVLCASTCTLGIKRYIRLNALQKDSVCSVTGLFSHKQKMK